MTLHAYTVVALHHDDPPRRIGILARSQADALYCARELFPERIISAAMLDADWEDSPA